jgi:hypothetical protein
MWVELQDLDLEARDDVAVDTKLVERDRLGLRLAFLIDCPRHQHMLAGLGLSEKLETHPRIFEVSGRDECHRLPPLAAAPQCLCTAS